jgi:hypothetical protein
VGLTLWTETVRPLLLLLSPKRSPVQSYRLAFDLLAAFDFIANQYSSSFEDIGTESAVAYAVEHLLVKHLIVLGVGSSLPQPA